MLSLQPYASCGESQDDPSKVKMPPMHVTSELCTNLTKLLLDRNILELSLDTIQNVYSHLHHALQQPQCGRMVPGITVPKQVINKCFTNLGLTTCMKTCSTWTHVSQDTVSAL